MNDIEKKASEKVMQLITANWINKPLYIVTKLGIPDILSEAPRTAGAIAEITKSYTPFLYRIMRVLASMGFFYESETNVFSITPLGKILQKDKMQPIVLMFLSEWHNQAFEKLYHSVQTGDIAFDAAFGKPSFEWFRENPEEADVFNNANRIKAIASHTEITRVYDFNSFNTLVDIGGGYGGLLFFILKAYTQIKGAVADLLYMKETVSQQIIDNDISERCDFIDCNFFEKVPENFDCYLLSNILHDWDDNKCAEILYNCYQSMPAKAVLLIIESIVPGKNEFSMTKLLDIEVLVMGGGKERTEREYLDLLDKSGFTLNRILNTSNELSILECSKQ